MQTKRLLWLGVPVLAVAALLPMSVSAGGAKHVRWDIIHLVGGAPPGPVTAGGVASASAPDGDTIPLTGSGKFVAPAGRNRGTSAVSGGGTWQNSHGNGTSPVPAI